MRDDGESEDRSKLIAAAQIANASGKIAEAERLFRLLVSRDESDLEAALYLGMTLAKAGKTDQALPTLLAVLEKDPDSFEALFWASILTRKVGDLERAAAFARRSVSIQPESPHALNNLGICEMELRNFDAAVAAFAQSAARRPDNPTVFRNAGVCLGFLGRDEEAIDAFQKAAHLAPNNPDNHLDLAKLYGALNEHEASIREAKLALRIDPGSAKANSLLALSLLHSDRADEAKRYSERAVGLDPKNALAYATLGSILQSQGDIDGANSAYLKSIELDPSQAFGYFALTHCKRITEEDRPLLVQMETLAEANRLPPQEIGSLHFGLGKGYENLGDFEKSMRHYNEANMLIRKLRYGGALFDKGQAALATDAKTSRYTKSFFQKSKDMGLDSDLPIFIVGMMRSGTTLVEQILSSHPDVAAGGELDFWPDRSIEGLDHHLMPDFPKLRALAGEYLQMLRRIGPGAAHVTDKMPANFLALGQIHSALPNARIIHMQRHPVDTALSIFATPNRARIDYANDKEAIVAAYKEYLRLMAHWRTVLPRDRLFEVRYEDLVQDRESVGKKLAEFCGLEWHDSMLQHEVNERSVLTPSAWQVRQPIYKTSVARWKKFEPWLGPFTELLSVE